ncbi:hypothetical protein BDB01DRAFT_834051 [Pilobolus umbonatus]|nr:hypothetical protein BDB01DRAFT_834051 [Pilobolus umbonatus]
MVVNLDPYLKIIENGDVPGVTCVDQSGHVISSVPSIVRLLERVYPDVLNGNRVINKNRVIIWCIKSVSKKEHSHKVAESPYSYAKLRRIEDEESYQIIVAMIESSNIANIKQKLLFADGAEGESKKDLLLHLQSNMRYFGEIVECALTMDIET